MSSWNDYLEKIAEEPAIPEGGLRPGLLMNDLTQTMSPEDAALVRAKLPWYKRSGPGLLPLAALGGLTGGRSVPDIIEAIRQRTLDPHVSGRTRLIGGLAGVVGLPALAYGLTRAGVFDKSSLTSSSKAIEEAHKKSGAKVASVESVFESAQRLAPFVDDVAMLAARLGTKKPSSAPVPAKIKQASLDQALGALYQEYGPTMQKHAAARFYSSLDKAQLAQEALGAPFCKLAQASRMDPWKMASQVVRGYLGFIKTASEGSSVEQELARFYVDWGDEMMKRAALPGAGLVGRAVKAVRGAVTRAPKPAVTKPTPAWTGGPRPTPSAPAAAPTTFREPITPKAAPSAPPASVPQASPAVEVSPSLRLPPGKRPLPAPTTLEGPQLASRPQRLKAEAPPQPIPERARLRQAAQKRIAWEKEQAAKAKGPSTGQMLTGAGVLGLGGLGAGYMMSGNQPVNGGSYA